MVRFRLRFSDDDNSRDHSFRAANDAGRRRAAAAGGRPRGGGSGHRTDRRVDAHSDGLAATAFARDLQRSPGGALLPPRRAVAVRSGMAGPAGLSDVVAGGRDRPMGDRGGAGDDSVLTMNFEFRMKTSELPL